MPGEQHHYVPRFLLKNFSRGKKPQIHVFDKSNDKVFQTNIKNVAAEKGFYDLEIEDAILSLEPGLSHIETKASRVIKRLIDKRNLKCIDKEGAVTLATFMAMQFVRTKEHRLRFGKLQELFAEKMRRMGATEENIAEQLNTNKGLPQDKLIGFQAVLGAQDFIPHFLDKKWILFETVRKHPFYISDNPIALHNDLDHGPFGNLGLAVPGIQIYFPISTTLCLALFCPSVVAGFHNAYDQIQQMDSVAPGLADTVMERPVAVRAFCEGLANGTPISVVEDNVVMMNSLQVTFSSRFVYCEVDSFGLVRDMIRDNDKYREGHEPSVS